MESDLISIIVPMYNCENEIRKTIDSIIKQTYQNLEIIIVDDGSTDNSSSIIKEISKNDRRIKYIYKSNAGVSSARNIGLENLNGSFVTFIDSDDYVHMDYIKIMYEYLKKYECDIVKCDFKSNYSLQPKIINEELIDKNKYMKLEKEMFESYKFNQVWGQLIDVSIIGKIKFDESLSMGEDFKFNYLLYKNLKKMMLIPFQLYFYNINTNGMNYNINQSRLNKKINDIFKIYHYIYFKYNNNYYVLERTLNEAFPHIIFKLYEEKKIKKYLDENIYNKEIFLEIIKKTPFLKNRKYGVGKYLLLRKKYLTLYLYSNFIYFLKKMKG